MASSKERKGKKPRQKKMKGNILEQIKDVYFKDLPDWLQSDLMEIHKIIVQGCHDEWQKAFYDDLRKSDWAKSMYDEFIEMPMGKRNTGSARLYKKKNRYSCMIQITGHVPNNREDIPHEEFHEFIRAVHINLKAKIRRKYDMALVCESEHGEHFEGFDVWPKQKVAKELWEQYPDVKVIEDKPHTEEEVTESTHIYSMDLECLPYDLQERVLTSNEFIRDNITENASDKLLGEKGFAEFVASVDLTDDDVGYTEITESEESSGRIYLTGPLYLKGVKDYKEEVTDLIRYTCDQLNYLMKDPTKKVLFERNQFVLALQPEYADKVVAYALVESAEPNLKKKTKLDAFVIQHNVDHSNSQIDASMLEQAEKATGTKFGKELTAYLLKYGYLGFEHVELYGMNSRQGLKSDLVSQTKYLHQHYPDTSSLVAIENQGEGDYYLVDGEDNVYEYDTNMKQLRKTGLKLFKYILKRFKAALKDSEPRKAKTYKKESADNDFFYHESDDRSEPSNPRATLDSLADTILKSQSVTPAVANTIATVITTHLLKEWAPGYTKFNIVLSKANTGNTLELKIPTMTRDFIGRFVESRESVEGFLHQNPTITVRMSPGIFRTMKNKSDLYTFFRSLIKYYADGLPRCALRLQSAIGTLHRKQKFQLTQSTLRGLVVLPFKMLTVFDDVDMTKKNFNVTSKEITSVCKYITGIAQNHSSDDKNSILDGLRTVIDAFNECTEFDENLKAIRAAFAYMENGVIDSDAWEKSNGIWQDQQVDLQETYHHPDPEVAYLQEANRVKKLKKLPRDLVAYITIETESIEDANDKMMIASYCLGKLDIVEWYIELIDTANPRYIVPHPRPYLVTLRTELLECYKNIMATKIPDKKNRPYLDVQYPAGLEG